jgi:MFS family permease
MQLNIAVGIGGTAWHAVCGPGMILSVFFSNHLHASDTMLGLLMSLSLLAAPFNLLGIWVYGRLRTRKGYWATAGILHRLYGFVLAGMSLWAGASGDRSTAIAVILGAAAVSWILAVASTPGWWSWMADLVPESIRGTFFGRRSAVIGAFNMAWFLGVTIALDTLGFLNLFYVYAAVFAIAGAVGVADIVIHCLIPEPQRHPAEARIGWKEFLAPLRDRNFVVFAVTVGLWGFSQGAFGPFIWPHVTGPRVGAAQVWMGIAISINQVGAIVTVTFWGLVMDRFGRKPAVLIGSLWVAMRAGYLLMTPANYMVLIPLVTLVQGVLGPGYNTGIQQLMLTLTPPRNRTSYVAWYSATVGTVAALGPLLGGVLKDRIGAAEWAVGGARLTSFHVVGLVSLVLCALVYLMMLRVREGQEKPVGFVMSRLFSPGVLRTFMNITTIGLATSGERAARALRTLDGTSSDLAMTDALARLDDPDAEVREEAARALGRIGSPEAVEALLARLRDPVSTIRPQAARALGRIGDSRAVPYLIEGLSSPSEELQDACAQALGEIGGRESVRRLRRLLDESRTERVLVAGAEAVSKHGIVEAAWEIFPRMHETPNPVLRRQLAIAMGNLLGRPGEFYQYLTGEQVREGVRLGRLFRRARRTVGLLRRHGPPGEGLEETVRSLLGELLRVRGLMEGQSHRAAVEGLCQIVGRFVRCLLGQNGPDDLVLEYALVRDVHLGLGFWFATEVRRTMGRIADPGLLQIDALLAAYFLSTYRPRPARRLA